MATALAMEPVHDRRGEPRLTPNLRVILETSIFIDTVPLVNIGRRGFSVVTPLAYPTGTPVWLNLPDGQRIAAAVVWFANNKIGARFVEPIEDSVFASLIAGAS